MMTPDGTVQELRRLVDRLHAALPRESYYVFLGVAPQATPAEVQEAFYARAERLHPDRYQTLGDAELRQRIYDVYKRIAEGYRVLSDPTLRRAYDRQVARGKIRYEEEPDEVEREKPALQRADAGLRNPSARRFFRLAQDALRAGDDRAAAVHLKMALSFEPRNPVVRELLTAVEKGARK